MKTLTNTLGGLASSLFFNVGLNQVAQQLDPLNRPAARRPATSLRSAEMCAVPCSFAKRAQR